LLLVLALVLANLLLGPFLGLGAHLLLHLAGDILFELCKVRGRRFLDQDQLGEEMEWEYWY